MFPFDLTKAFFNVFRRNKKEGILERNGFIITVGERFKNLPSGQILLQSHNSNNSKDIRTKSEVFIQD